ncbi:hypothetical protein [Candidatus Solincola sp.]|nr:hypothetical protein [Actinomycetota bacterium]
MRRDEAGVMHGLDRRRYFYPLVPIAALCLMAAVLAAGCGRRGESLSASEYKKRISEIHDGVAWDLSYVLESLVEVSGDEYYQLQEVGDLFERAKEIFSGAYRALDSLDPPEEALELHLDLMHFYADGERETSTVVNSLGLFQIVLPMLVDVDNLALPSLPEQPQPEEIRGAAEEDARTMHMYLGELEGITPPEEMREYLDKLRALFRGIRDMVSGVLQAAPSKEMESLADFRQRFAPLAGEAVALQGTVQAYLAGVGGRIDGLIERGGELAARIKIL